MSKPSIVERQWYVIDVQDVVLGRAASQVAMILRGKHKPTYTPHVDTGDNVIILNADKIKLTGKKLDQKFYRYHTGYPGGLKEIPFRRLLKTKSAFAFKNAVRGMLPKGPLGNAMLKKLHVYEGAEHVHQAQKPVEFDINTRL